MPDFGFPAQPRNASLGRIIADLRSRGDTARVAAVTGRFADVTEVRKGRVNELMQLQKSINDLTEYSEAIALAETRADTMQSSLSAISDVSQTLSDTVATLLTNGTDANFRNVSIQARQDLAGIVANLNADFAGRTLFAGDDAGTSAIVDADSIYSASVPVLEGQPTAGTAYAALRTEFMGAGGLFDTTFYIGGAGDTPLTEVAPGERINYTVKADEDPMREVLLNVTVMSAAYDMTNAIPLSERRALIETASEGLRNAIAQVVSVKSRLGSAEGRIASIKARNIASEAAFTLQYNDLAAADTYEAALALNEIDGQLEVAFSTTARISNLSLINYI